MNLLFGCLYFAVSLYFALFEGVGACLAFCYIPALLLFRAVNGYEIKAGIPELSAINVASMAMLLGMLLRVNKKFTFRWRLVDTIVLLAPLLTIISAMSTENVGTTYENLHTGYNEAMKQIFGWIVPYFAARGSFSSERTRRQCLWGLIASIFVLTPFALIEMRLWPQFYYQVMTRTGLQLMNDPLVMSRLGYFRAQVSFTHPIFFGDACLSMLVLVLVLAHTTSIGTRNWLVRVAAACVAFEIVCSLSFGPFFGFIAGILVFLLLYYTTTARAMLVPLSLVAIGVVVAFTYHLAVTPLPERPRDRSIDDSFYIRRMIIQHSWPLIMNAGWFGHGRVMSPDDLKELKLESVDNAYILFAMCRGWLYAGVWVLLPLLVGWRAVKGIRAYKSSNAHVFPLAVGTAGVMGVSAAFYGVWAGWAGEPYTMLWLITIGFTMSLSDMCIEAGKTAIEVPKVPQMRMAGHAALVHA